MNKHFKPRVLKPCVLKPYKLKPTHRYLQQVSKELKHEYKGVKSIPPKIIKSKPTYIHKHKLIKSKTEPYHIINEELYLHMPIIYIYPVRSSEWIKH